jgi:hypothetical protein
MDGLLARIVEQICMGLKIVALKPQGKLPLKSLRPIWKDCTKVRISWNKLWRYEMGWVDFVWLRMAFFYADSNELFSTTTKYFDRLNSYFNNSWRWYITFSNTQLSGPRPLFYIINRNIIFRVINSCPSHEEGSRSSFRNFVFYIGRWRKPRILAIFWR